MTCGPDTVTAQSPGSVEGSAASSDWFRYEAFLSPNSPGNFPLNHRQNHVLTFGILSLFGVGVRVLGCCVSWLSYSQALKAFQPGADTRAPGQLLASDAWTSVSRSGLSSRSRGPQGRWEARKHLANARAEARPGRHPHPGRVSGTRPRLWVLQPPSSPSPAEGLRAVTLWEAECCGVGVCSVG